MKNLLTANYKDIFERELLKEIAEYGQFKEIDDDESLYDIGQSLHYMPLILRGNVKIVNEDSEGNEFLLYYLEVGDCCAMTMNCCIGKKESIVRATSEQGTVYCNIPLQRMEEWLVKYPSWRNFVFDNYDARMRKLIETIDALAFCNLQERLFRYLKKRAAALGSPVLEITHHQIATDLNTSRAVISRLIKNLVDDQKIDTLRNKVIIL